MGGQKVALLVLPKGRLCVSGQNQMCHLCGWLKLFLKNAGGEKIKNIALAMSVGLLVVRLLYRCYVFGHLSKWFTFSQFIFVCLLLCCRPLHLLPTYLSPQPPYPIYIPNLGCSHGLCERSACGWGKAKCATCGLAKIVFKKCAMGKK